MVIINQSNEVLVTNEFTIKSEESKNESGGKTYTLKAHLTISGKCFEIFSLEDDEADSNYEKLGSGSVMTPEMHHLDPSIEKVSAKCLFDSIVCEVVKKIKGKEDHIDIHGIVLECKQRRGKSGYVYKISNQMNSTVGYIWTTNIDIFKSELTEFNKDSESVNKVFISQKRSDFDKHEMYKILDDTVPY